MPTIQNIQKTVDVPQVHFIYKDQHVDRILDFTVVLQFQVPSRLLGCVLWRGFRPTCEREHGRRILVHNQYAMDHALQSFLCIRIQIEPSGSEGLATLQIVVIPFVSENERNRGARLMMFGQSFYSALPVVETRELACSLDSIGGSRSSVTCVSFQVWD